MAFKKAHIAAFNVMVAYIDQHLQTLWQRMQALIARFRCCCSSSV